MQARIDYLIQYNVAPLDKEKQTNCYKHDPKLDILICQQNTFQWFISPLDNPIYENTIAKFQSNIIGKKVLIIGYSNGTLTKAIRDLNPAQLWIIEPSVTLINKLEKDGFISGGTTHIIDERWEDSTRIPGFPTNFDFIYYNVGLDAYPLDYNGVLGFTNLVDNFLAEGGVYSWWNDNNAKMNTKIVINNEEVQCSLPLVLNDHGFTIQTEMIEIDPVIISTDYDVVPFLNKSKYLNGYKHQLCWINKNTIQ